MHEKIITIEELARLSKVKGSRVLVGGCFDILHYGHLTFLKNAKEEGDVLIVMLEPDEFIQTNKHRKPTHTHDQRAEILAHLTVVDYIIKLPKMKDNADYFELVKKIRPSIIAVTENDAKIELKRKQATSIGAEIKEVVHLLPFSSSQYAPFFRS